MNPFKFGQVVGAKDFCARPESPSSLSELTLRIAPNFQ